MNKPGGQRTLSVMLISKFLCSAAFAANSVMDAARTAGSVLLRVDPMSTIVACAASAPNGNEEARRYLNDPPGFHGMLLFGTGPWYISHLPMFHPPHDYQAILEVRLPPAAASAMAARATSVPYFTFAPNTEFVLPQMVNDRAVNGGPMGGTIFAGHFERGGTPLGEFPLEIVRVVYFKKLNPADPKPTGNTAPYVVFGSGNQFFAAQTIGGRPGVDHVFPVGEASNVAAWRAQIGNAPYVQFSGHQDGQRARFTNTSGANVDAPWSEGYTERGDLE